jgi:serine/threonine protein kinase
VGAQAAVDTAATVRDVGSIGAGSVLDERYRIIERRASGATATVWKAEDNFLRRCVAIKILHDHLASDPELLSRFVDEARTAATVNHPALVAVYDSILDQPGIVLEWIEGPDLRQRLDRGPIRPDDIAEIGATICDGLTALHNEGLIHRDVKPANILLTGDGQPKLTDFGIATDNAGDRTATGVVLGTAKYLAPEQVRGRNLDGRTDVFALAAVLYEALAGRPPWVREGDLPTALARLEEDPVDLREIQPDIAPHVTNAVMAGLEREPDDRWPSAAAFRDALRGASTRSGSTTRSIVTSPDLQTTENLPSRPDPTLAVDVAVTPGPRVRPRRRLWPRLIVPATMIAIAVLGWTLVTAIDGDSGSTVASDASGGPRVVTADAFDPEGSGPTGEHNDRAHLAIDGDTSTAWPTERYDARDLGAKSGVGLVLGLDRVADLSTVAIRTQGSDDWAAEIYVSTGMTADGATGIASFGEVAGTAEDLGAIAEITLDSRGDTVVIWLTDLGVGELPVHLAIAEVTIR